jgi:hypothetical protein
MKIKLFLIGFFFIHLDAFSLGGVPVPWIGLCICMLASIKSQFMPFQSLSVTFIFMIALIVASTALNWPTKAPNSYIFYRMLNFLGFYMIVNFMTLHASSPQFVKFFEKHAIRIGLIIAFISIFVFFLHVFGLGDIPRNRIGTAGLDQPIAFTFEVGGLVSRALGTFREPSFLAMALLLPGIIALKNRKWRSLMVIISALSLTYSLGIFFAIIFGFLTTCIFSMNAGKQLKTLLTYGLLFLVSAYVLLNVFDDFIFFQRLSLITSLKLTETSRGYIYENLNMILGSWVTGVGIGGFGFRLSELLGTVYPVSTLNLFLNILTSGGVLALMMLLYWFVYPNFLMRRYREYFTTSEVFLLLLPLNVFVFLYLTTFEELLIWHAIALGLVLGRIRHIRSLSRSAPAKLNRSMSVNPEHTMISNRTARYQI